MSKKLGQYGIEDIPELSRADLVKTNLPMQKEFCEVAMSSDYAKSSNKCNMLISGLFILGGQVFFSNEAKSTFGNEQVQKAMKYYKAFCSSKDCSSEEKKAVCSWIADNIFDVDKMSS